jgi:hypothetical protein
MYIVKNTIQTGNVKWSDYEIKKEFLTQKDIEETKKFVKEYQEQYANLPYLNPKNDEDFVKSVNYFLSVDCNLESLGTYAKGKNNYLSKNGINEISFAAIVYISKIQEKLAELENLINKSEQSFVKKENVKQIIKEIETWNDRYNELKEKLAKITPKTTDSQDTIKDIAEIDFSKQNAIIFLRPTPSSKTLYETGLMKNGNSKNHEISEEGKKYLKKILKNLSNNTIELKTGYHNFTAKLRRKLPSGNAIDLTIGEKNVERASEPDSEARVIMIRLNVRQENKKKIGIGNNHGVILVISPFEVNFSNEKNSYAQMISIIDENKEAIEEIMDAFQNPNTPKEVLQQYIADSFGLLNELISDQPNTPLIDNENMQVSRGGRK